MAALGLGDDRGLPVPRPARPPPGARRRAAAARARRARRASAAARPALGRRLAQLPVDPRFGRMVLEADRLRLRRRGDRHRRRAVDPGPARAARRPARRGRPAARALRRRASDFLAYLNLWRYLREQQRELSRQPVPQALPRGVPALPAHPRVAGPRRRSCARRRKGVGVDAQPRAGRAATRIHQALLAGLLSHVGMQRRRARREYVGARGARFALFPGSGAGQQAAGVGDGRRAGRDLAAVGPRRRARSSPQWIEPLAGAPGQAHATPSRAGTARAARSSRPSA